jgi:hypothetical protein
MRMSLVCVCTFGCFALMISPTSALSQNVGRLDVAAADLADENAVPSQCRTQWRSAIVASGQLPTDSLLVRVVKDTLGAADISPVSFEVRIGSQSVFTIQQGDSNRIYTAPTSLQRNPIFVVRSSDKRTICASPVPLSSGPSAVDTLAQRLVNLDSMTIDSIRRRSTYTGSSFVMLSLIKSVAGEIPAAEFFDVRLRFSSASRLFTLGNLDVALSQAATDTANRKLTEGGFSFNLLFQQSTSKRKIEDSNGNLKPIPQRGTYAGLGFRIFNTVQFLNLFTIGGVELLGSTLEGSSASVSYVHRMYRNPSIPVGTTDTTNALRPRADNNLLIDFFLRVPGVQFLDRLRLRGGLLLPLKKPYSMESRIVLTVPIVDLQRF